jgi:hypothetical protein
MYPAAAEVVPLAGVMQQRSSCQGVQQLYVQFSLLSECFNVPHTVWCASVVFCVVHLQCCKPIVAGYCPVAASCSFLSYSVCGSDLRGSLTA